MGPRTGGSYVSARRARSGTFVQAVTEPSLIDSMSRIYSGLVYRGDHNQSGFLWISVNPRLISRILLTQKGCQRMRARANTLHSGLKASSLSRSGGHYIVCSTKVTMQ